MISHLKCLIPILVQVYQQDSYQRISFRKSLAVATSKSPMRDSAYPKFSQRCFPIKASCKKVPTDHGSWFSLHPWVSCLPATACETPSLSSQRWGPVLVEMVLKRGSHESLVSRYHPLGVAKNPGN